MQISKPDTITGMIPDGIHNTREPTGGIIILLVTFFHRTHYYRAYSKGW